MIHALLIQPLKVQREPSDVPRNRNSKLKREHFAVETQTQTLLLLIALCRYSLGLIGSSGEVRGDASSTGLLAMDPSRLMLSTGAALVAGGYVRGHVSLCLNMCSETL